MSFLECLAQLGASEDLTAEQTESCFAEIFTDQVPDDQIKDFLVALYKKGETHQEVLGAVRYLRSHGEDAHCKSKDLIDCCGTGGDQKGTFNVSTAVSFVLAGAGLKVAKHGNRAASSKSGAADILEALGINILASSKVMARCIDEVGIGFLFAPNYYPLMKKVGPIRKELGHRSIFNILGPLLNPAGAKVQLIGVFESRLTRLMAEVLKSLGSESAVIVHGQDGMDEFTLTTNNTVSRLQQGEIQDFEFDPRQSGYAYCRSEDLMGTTPQENAERLKICLKGHSEPVDHVVHINAAWGLMAAGQAEHFMDALLMAQDSVSSGRAYQKLEQLIEATHDS